MQATLIALAVMLSLAGTAQAQVVANCAAIGAAPTTTVLPTALAPVSDALMAPRHQLGSPAGVLAQAFDESLSVDQVLYRNKLAACAAFASVTPAPAPGALPTPASALPVVPGAAGTPATTDPAAYVPRTEFDNAPWRFDMNQNGKRMTADEFTAWMEAKGVRVVKPRAPVATAMPAAEGEVTGSVPPIPAVAPSPVTPPEAGDDQPSP